VPCVSASFTLHPLETDLYRFKQQGISLFEKSLDAAFRLAGIQGFPALPVFIKKKEGFLFDVDNTK
jgi:hypothetical protein